MAEFLRRELAGDIEEGDRVPVGEVDIVVRRRRRAHEVDEIGLAMEHGAPDAPAYSAVPDAGGTRALFRAWRDRRKAKGGSKVAVAEPAGAVAKPAEESVAAPGVEAEILPPEETGRRPAGGVEPE